MELLNVVNLSVSVGAGSQTAKIVDDLSFRLERGKCLGIVGESGSGKSTAAMAIMGLLDKRVLRVSGEVCFDGRDLQTLSTRDVRELQGTQIAMIFQDPMSSLNPVLRVGEQIVECVQSHETQSRKQAWSRAVEVLSQVGMPDPEGMMRRYPHQLSGGQRQRIMIAMAIVFKPRLLIADEPTTALDLTIQAQILVLLKQLSQELDMTVVLITHDLGVVSQMCDDVIVLYSGKDVERGATERVLESPQHPYTIGLLGAHPSMESDTDRLIPVPGAPPSIWERPSGCTFRDRCNEATTACAVTLPSQVELKGGRHRVACHQRSDAKALGEVA